jgi:hypothetical protein
VVHWSSQTSTLPPMVSTDRKFTNVAHQPNILTPTQGYRRQWATSRSFNPGEQGDLSAFVANIRRLTRHALSRAILSTSQL